MKNEERGLIKKIMTLEDAFHDVAQRHRKLPKREKPSREPVKLPPDFFDLDKKTSKLSAKEMNLHQQYESSLLLPSYRERYSAIQKKLKLIAELKDTDPSKYSDLQSLRERYFVTPNSDESDNALFPEGDTAVVVLVHTNVARARRTLTHLVRYFSLCPLYRALGNI